METDSYSLKHIADYLNAELILKNEPDSVDPDDASVISGIASLHDAKKGDLTFLAQKKYLHQLADTNASVVIVTEQAVDESPTHCLVVANPYLAYAKVTELFKTAPAYESGIHPSAVVDSSASIHSSAYIGANAVIQSNAVIGASTTVGACCVVGESVVIGDTCYLYPNVTIYHDVAIGDDCIIHSGTVIGSDGFGFAPTSSGWHKIHQVGRVLIGNRVEVGSNVSIDRGAMTDTVIHDGVIIDNLVHIAHNCEIGENTAIAGCVGMAGGAKIGKNCQFGGGVGIAGHIEVADNVIVLGLSRVTGNIMESGTYASGTGTQPQSEWRRSAIRFTQLEKTNKRIQELEQRLKQLES